METKLKAVVKVLMWLGAGAHAIGAAYLLAAGQPGAAVAAAVGVPGWVLLARSVRPTSPRPRFHSLPPAILAPGELSSRGHS